MNNEQKTPAKMLSIWTLVGLVLGIYGLLITGMGIYYVVQPETLTATHEVNPSLWWGLAMVVAAAIFLGTQTLANRKGS